MISLGYALSSEEHPPNDLVKYAQRAEEIGFFALISDHFHPWVSRQGQSPFVWSVLGAIAHEWRPTSALGGDLFTEIKTPAHFEQAVALAREEDVAQAIVCSPDPQIHLDKIRKYAQAGYTHVYIHQVGLDQEGFFKFYEREILPHIQ